jgi:hypothetical protein
LTKISVGSIEKLIRKLHEIAGIAIKRIPAAKLGSGGSPRPKAFVGVRTTTIPSKCMNKTASLYRFGGSKNHTIELIIVLEAQSKVIHE